MSEDNDGATEVAEEPVSTEVAETETEELPSETTSTEDGGEAADPEAPPATGKPVEPKPAEAAKEKEAAPVKLKFKVMGGEEKEYSQAQAQELLNKGLYFDRARGAMEEAGKIKTAAEKVVELVGDNPIASFIEIRIDKLGGDKLAEERALDDAKKMCQAFLQQCEQLEKASPEERRIFEREREIDRREQEMRFRESKAKESQEEESKRALDRKFDKFNEDHLAELKTQGLKNDRTTVRLLHEVLAEAVEAEETITAQEAVRRVKEEREKLLWEEIGQVAPDELLKRAPETAKALREKDLEALRKKKTTRPITPGRSAASAPREKAPAKTQWISTAQMNQELSQSLNGR